MTALPPLAVTIGDPAGIGPEIILKAWMAREAASLRPFFVTHGAEILEAAAQACDIDCPVIGIDGPEDARSAYRDGLPVWRRSERQYTPGKPHVSGARLAYKSLGQAIEYAFHGAASAVVTAPVSKSAIAEVDSDFIGQTELLAQSLRLPLEHSVMMLAGPTLRTVPMTVHCAIADVPALLTQDLIVERTRIVARALQTDFGITNPRIAIAGLNPHAGEDGRMGTEEIEVIAPAIARLRGEGIDASGPHPADTLFAPHKRGTYDVAIAMYHDQALVPLKALDFDQGVNVTLGLPIVRTSPDHGTAFDIAGKGIARPDAMIAAIRMAGEIAERRANG
ncbi:4-hydroxythreonine-4-phosphate dehydrogenase PdxA [Aurantiacibacter sp. D1-12]|uniref:4-hydroxythreonine-4-phosphate dehydrogenase PdxA n=1 Tax=Aurantiacibacter sp. D1-12 TaxID=2993658 RepID=UPI00237D2910|nr:4-hydroxythreonine-4-phosphate dehydrogenase PdxA [Aurantiacibacter sp. D1-12]MDE1466220.1 4-hydroxythreonine-4-phosphate dehydrogenase PdxA [Aurantiacibacter sp. D1-12]